MDEPAIPFARNITIDRPEKGGGAWRVLSTLRQNPPVTNAETELITAYFRPFLDKLLSDESPDDTHRR